MSANKLNESMNTSWCESIADGAGGFGKIKQISDINNNKNVVDDDDDDNLL